MTRGHLNSTAFTTKAAFVLTVSTLIRFSGQLPWPRIASSIAWIWCHGSKDRRMSLSYEVIIRQGDPGHEFF
eukprot:289348-Amphidinium_carterae.1